MWWRTLVEEACVATSWWSVSLASPVGSQEPRQAQLPPPTPAVPGRMPKVLQMEPFSQEAVELARTLQENPDIAQVRLCLMI